MPKYRGASEQGLFAVTGDDLAGAVADIVTAGGGVLYIREGQTVTTATTTTLPNEVRGVRLDGEIVLTGNTSAFTRTGVVNGVTTNITAAITAGQRTVSATPTDIAVGDWVFVVSADTLPGTTDKLGYLRRIKAVASGSVTFDSAIPRNMPDSTRRYRKITLAAPLAIWGTGTIRHATPATHTAAMLDFVFCQDVAVRGITLRDGGDRAIVLSHVAGFDIDCVIDNFLDDLANSHVGYGVDCRGGSRDGRVTGRISRCRHAFTTNVGPSLTEFNFYGEPENVHVAPVTWGCTDKALDSHRAGWGLTYVVNDKGSGGGIQVRADNVTVSAAVIEGSYVGAAINVSGDLILPPNFGTVQISNHQGSAAISLYSDAYFAAPPRFHNIGGADWAINGASQAYVPQMVAVVP